MTKRQLGKLYKAILLLRNKQEVDRFFKDLMTPQELENFADRWEVAQQLYEGKTQRQVSADTGVSIATVTRVNRFLRRGADGYRLVLDRIKQTRKTLSHHSRANRLAVAS